MEIFGSVVVLAVLFYSYPLQKDEVTNLSKDNVSSGRPFTIDSSASRDLKQIEQQQER
jgi:hypothetical protein